MDNNFDIPISIEKFAAYLDGNLPQYEIDDIDAIIGGNPDMEALVSMADVVDEDVQHYINDDFLYEADITALENGEFDLPEIPNINDNEITLPFLAEPAAANMDPTIEYPYVATPAAASAAEPIEDEIDYWDPEEDKDLDEARHLDGLDGMDELSTNTPEEGFPSDM